MLAVFEPSASQPLAQAIPNSGQITTEKPAKLPESWLALWPCVGFFRYQLCRTGPLFYPLARASFNMTHLFSSHLISFWSASVCPWGSEVGSVAVYGRDTLIYSGLYGLVGGRDLISRPSRFVCSRGGGKVSVVVCSKCSWVCAGLL